MNIGVHASTTETRRLIVVFGSPRRVAMEITLHPDGISYVDVSGHYLAGNWPLPKSGYWSPLYPRLLAAARLLGGTDIGTRG